MAVLILVTQEALDETAAPYQRLVTTFKQDLRKVANNSWLVKTDLSTKDFSETVFPRGADGKAEAGHVVLVVGTWWGFYDVSLWEWLVSAQMSPKPNG